MFPCVHWIIIKIICCALCCTKPLDGNQRSNVFAVKPTSLVMSQQPTGELTTGDEVKLECRVGNSNPPADLRWTRGVFEEIRPEDANYHKATDWYGLAKPLHCILSLIAVQIETSRNRIYISAMKMPISNI